MLNYSTTPDANGNAEADVCAGAAQLSLNEGSTFVGANEIEYYFR